MKALAVALVALAFLAVACEKKSDVPVQAGAYDPKIDGPALPEVRPNPDILQDQARIAKAMAKPAEGSSGARPAASAPAASAPAVAGPGAGAVKNTLTALAASTNYTDDTLDLLSADEKARAQTIVSALAAAEKFRQTLQGKFQMNDLPPELKEVVALLPAGVPGLPDLRKMPLDQLTIQQQGSSVVVTPSQGRKMTFVQVDGKWQLSLDDPTKQELAALQAVADGLTKVITKLEAEIAGDQLIKDSLSARAKELVDQDVAAARQQLLKGSSGTGSPAPATPAPAGPAAPSPATPAAPAPTTPAAPAAPTPATPATPAPATPAAPGQGPTSLPRPSRLMPPRVPGMDL